GLAAAGERGPAGRLLDGPGALALPAGDDPAPRPRVARAPARPAHPRREHPRGPRPHPPPPARQAEGPRGRGDEGRRPRLRPAHGAAREARVPETPPRLRLLHLQPLPRPSSLLRPRAHPPQPHPPPHL